MGVNFVDKTPDNKKQIFGARAGYFIEWSVQKEKIIKNHAKGNSAFFEIYKRIKCHNGKYFLSTNRSCIKLWSFKKQSLIKEYQTNHHFGILSLAITSNGKWQLTGDETGVMKQWNFKNHKLFKDWGKVHTWTFYMCVLSNSETQFTLAYYSELKEWNIETQQLIRNQGVVHGCQCSCITATPEGAYLFTADKEGCLKQWNVQTGRLEQKYESIHNKSITCIEVTSNGKSLFSVSSDEHLKELDIDNKVIMDYGIIGDVNSMIVLED